MLNINTDKLIEILKNLLSFIGGYFTAKREEKIDNLEKELDIKEKQEEIKKEVLTREEVYDVKTW